MSPVRERRAMVASLNRILEREYNSLLRYLRDSDPWIPEEHREPMMRILGRLADEDLHHSEEIARLVLSLGGAPLLGNYSMQVADLSYLALAYSLRPLLAWKAELRGLYRAVIKQAGDWPQITEPLIVLLHEEDVHRCLLEEAFRTLNPGADVPRFEEIAPRNAKTTRIG